MRKLSTYPMLLAVMLVCIAAKIGYASAIDCLTYEYRGNQVTRISDDAPELTYFNAFHFVDGADDDVEYTYDSSGNTVSDLNRGIDRITYDVNHRPHTISFSNGAHTGYICDAQGRKLRTEHRVPSLQPTLPGVIGPGISWGFSSAPKPWTAEEQKQAVALKRIYDKYKLTD